VDGYGAQGEGEDFHFGEAGFGEYLGEFFGGIKAANGF